MSRSRVAVLGALGAGMLAVAAACSANEGTCIRKSDCEAPYTCVEGTCRTDEVLASTPADGDGGASDQ